MTSHQILPETRRALIVGACALLLSSLPYLAGFAVQTPDRVFDGAVFDLPDYHSHLARMQQGRRGEWLYRLLFTSEDHDGALLPAFYVALGHLARLTSLSLPIVFQAARLVFGALFLAAAYRLIATLADRSDVRRAAFVLVAFSSGVGWLVQMVAPADPGGISPIDFWLIDANSFFSIMMFPHFTASTACLLEIYTRLLRPLDSAEVTPARQYSALALLSFFLVSVHPYAIAVVVGPAVVFGLVQVRRRGVSSRRWWRLVAATLFGAAPPLLYNAILFSSQPVFRQWAAQNVTLSPPPIYYLLGYGLVLLFALMGVRAFIREQRNRALLILAWIGVVSILIYLSVGIQRRFVEGVHVPLSVIAAYGLVAVTDRLQPRVRFVAGSLLLALAAMSNVYMVIGYSVTAASRSEAMFHASGLVEALGWLGDNSEWDDTVLASESAGSLVAAQIGHRVVLGHWAETVDYDNRRNDVAAFFNGRTPDAERIEMLRRLGVCFVLHSDDERALGDFDPAQVEYLRLVYDGGAVAVYQVARLSP